MSPPRPRCPRCPRPTRSFFARRRRRAAAPEPARAGGCRGARTLAPFHPTRYLASIPLQRRSATNGP